MVCKIIKTEYENPVKAEFDRITMPDESKRRVLEQLLKDKKEREEVPENAVKIVSSTSAKISGSKPLVSIAAAISLCIAGVWVLVSLNGGIKDSGEEDFNTSVKSVVSEADSSDYNWGGAKIDSALDYSIYGGTSVELSGLFHSDSQIQSNPLYMKLEAKNGNIYALRISWTRENGEDILGKISAVRNGDEWDYSMTEYVSLEPDRNNYFIPGGFYSSDVYYETDEEQGDGYETGFDLICYNDDMQKVGEWSSEILDIYEKYERLYDTKFLLSEDMQTLYIYAYQKDESDYDGVGKLVLFSSEAGSGKYTEINLPENEQEPEKIFSAVNNGKLYYEVSTEQGNAYKFESGYYDLLDENKKYILFNNYDLLGEKKLSMSIQGKTDDQGRLYYWAVSEDGYIKVVRIAGSDFQEVYEAQLPEKFQYSYNEITISSDGKYFALLCELGSDKELDIIDLESGEEVNNYTVDSSLHCAAIDSVSECIYLYNNSGTNTFYRYDLRK